MGHNVAHAPSKTHRARAVFIPIFTRRDGIPALLRAASPLSTTLPASHRKHCGADVGCGAGFHPAADFQSAHAPALATKVCGARDVPGRDRPLLLATPLDRESSECRQECRHGTQECVRHQQSRPPSPAPPWVCGSKDVPEGIVPRSCRRLWITNNPRCRKNATRFLT